MTESDLLPESTGDAGSFQHVSGHADLPPRCVRDPLALAVALGGTDEGIFERRQVDRRAERLPVALQVTPRVCYTRPPTETPNTDGFVEVDEVTLQGEIKRIFTSPGFAEEEVTLFVATGLERVSDHEPDPSERIEVVPWPLADLDGAIDECVDAKSLIGLLLFRRMRD